MMILHLDCRIWIQKALIIFNFWKKKILQKNSNFYNNKLIKNLKIWMDLRIIQIHKNNLYRVKLISNLNWIRKYNKKFKIYKISFPNMKINKVCNNQLIKIWVEMIIFKSDKKFKLMKIMMMIIMRKI